MLTILDQAIQLTGRVLGYLLDWPFLMFVLLVWIVTRFRDEIGSFLDRRAGIRRSELASAIREEVSPLARDLANVKVDARELKAHVYRIDSAQSEYRSDKLIAPIQDRISALEHGEERLHAELDAALRSDLLPELKTRVDALSQEILEVKQIVHALETRIATVAPEEALRAVHEGLEASSGEIGKIKEELNILKSDMERKEQSVQSGSLSGQGGSESARAVESAVQLRVMREALSSTRWEWRRVKKLASLAGVTEEQAVEMLEMDSAFTVKKDDWGRRIARLTSN